jgi:hypothetical protein
MENRRARNEALFREVREEAGEVAIEHDHRS